MLIFLLVAALKIGERKKRHHQGREDHHPHQGEAETVHDEQRGHRATATMPGHKQRHKSQDQTHHCQSRGHEVDPADGDGQHGHHNGCGHNEQGKKRIQIVDCHGYLSHLSKSAAALPCPVGGCFWVRACRDSVKAASVFTV